ncbi:hypothetical protein BT93_K0852 [Corymbia citriodora subsp. variegata]|nr:hypothetical protein BT93_K0852 [Corymbia citriodora subsp. variegata]
MVGWRVEKKLPNPAVFLREPFHVLSTTLLTLLLPLSFLLAFAPADHALEPITFLFSIVFDANPTLLLALLSILGIATLVHCLTGHVDVFGKSTGSVCRPRLYMAWVLLFASQICVLFGIQGSLPVVDDTILGFPREEKWTERAAAAVSFGSLWWWRLKEEVESLAVVSEVKMELLMVVAVADYVAWWLYYLTVTIGMVKIVKGFVWLGLTFFRRFTGNSGDDSKYFPGPGPEPDSYGVDRRHQ